MSNSTSLVKFRQQSQDRFKAFKSHFISYLLITSGTTTLIMLFLVGASHYPSVKALLTMLPFNAEELVQNLIFGCIGLFAIALGLERNTDSINIQKGLETQAKALEALSKNVAVITEMHNHMMHNSKKLTSHLEMANPLKFPDALTNAAINLLDPVLEQLFHDEFRRKIEFFSDAIKDKKVNFSDKDLFCKVYRNWLKLYPDSTIYATSSPAATYFWSMESEPNTKIEDIIVEFIKGGGKMIRVFFLKSEDLTNQNTLSRMRKHVKFGVDVYYSLIQPTSNVRYFVVDKDERVTFRIDIRPDRTMRDFGCTLDREYAKRHKEEFEELLDKNYTFKFNL